MAKSYKNENGLNKTTEFGADASSELLFSHKFTWKPSEFAMLLGVGGLGAFLALMVKPEVLGLAFLGGALYLTTVNASKKKKSLLQLFKTNDGLKLYHNGILTESASDESFTLEDVVEVVVVQTQPLPKLMMKAEAAGEETAPYMKVPIRFLRSLEFQEFLKAGEKSGKIKLAKQVSEEMSKWAK
jgi:hypothetical protein